MRVQPLSLVGVIVSIAAITPIPPIHAEQPVHELQVTASKFAFEPATIQVVAGEPVRLVLRSADAVHGFAIRELNIDVDIPKGGAAVIVGFTAPAPRPYKNACSEFRGTGHSPQYPPTLRPPPTRP